MLRKKAKKSEKKVKKSEKKKRKKCHNFMKTGEGGGSKAIYKLYKKTGVLVQESFP